MNGMNIMARENKSINCKEVCAIIKICSESGVRELSFGGLKVSFGRHANEVLALDNTYAAPQAIHEAQAIEASQKAIEQEELSTKEEQLSQMMIEDPLEYEAMVARGELES